jgi:uncharacterized protein YndB with AHSA1/START domain
MSGGNASALGALLEAVGELAERGAQVGHGAPDHGQERTPDGTEHDWGEVLAWEPPRRLAYLWHLGTERSRATEVDISFSGGTTVTITHRGWERLGADAPAWRQRNLGGWSGLLPHFRQAAAAPADSGAPESGG